jgi:hypothetical protein
MGVSGQLHASAALSLGIGGWVGPRAVLVVKRKSPSPRRESNPKNSGRPACSPGNLGYVLQGACYLCPAPCCRFCVNCMFIAIFPSCCRLTKVSLAFTSPPGHGKDSDDMVSSVSIVVFNVRSSEVFAAMNIQVGRVNCVYPCITATQQVV